MGPMNAVGFDPEAEHVTPQFPFGQWLAARSSIHQTAKDVVPERRTLFRAPDDFICVVIEHGTMTFHFSSTAADRDWERATRFPKLFPDPQDNFALVIRDFFSGRSFQRFAE